MATTPLNVEIGGQSINEPELRRMLFEELDTRARQIEAQWKATWSELADICATVRDSELWREGNYDSFGSWLKAACPCSRSTAYSVMGLREELKELSNDDIKQIPLGNAQILADTPKARRNGKILEDAKAQPPREFLSTVILSVPEAHLEQKQVHKFRLTYSQSKKCQEGFEMWRLLNDDPEAPVEDTLEGIIADYIEVNRDEYRNKLAKA